MRHKSIFLVFILLLISSVAITYLLLFNESESWKDDETKFHSQLRKLEKEVQQLLQLNRNLISELRNKTNHEKSSSENNRVDEKNPQIKTLAKSKEALPKINERYKLKISEDDVNNKLDTAVESDQVTQTPIIAILVISCNRVTVKRCIDQLLKYRPNEEQFPIIVSQDCGHSQTSNVIKSYGKKIAHIELPDQSDIDVPPKEKKFKGYFKIARHYGWALNETFKQGYQAVVVVEDDLDVAPDFYEYFLGTYPILKADSTLWCVSAWNDNGKSELIDSKSPHLLYRTDFFPGLGWMLTKDLWVELSPKWPHSYWDDWIRQPEQRKNRACLRPEVSRTRTFGKFGVSNGLFFEKHLQYIKLNEQFVPFSRLNLTYLIKEYYDLSFMNEVYHSQVVTFTDLKNGKIGHNKSVRIPYYTRQSYKNSARLFGLMDDFKSGVPRTGYRGIVAFYYKGHRVYLAPSKNWSGYDLSWTMNQLPMHNAIKPLAWLEGIWRTESVGLGKFPTINPFKYCEEITFTSIGQPMLNYAAQSWHPEKKVPMHREVGFLKIVPESNAVSLFVAHNFGLTTVEEGEVNDNIINLSSANVSRKTEGSKPPAVLQIKREFKLVDDLLHQTVYMATESTPELTEHLKVVYKKQQEALCK